MSKVSAVPRENPRANDHVAAALVLEDALTARECRQVRRLAQRLPVADVDYYPAPPVPVRQARTWRLARASVPWLDERLDHLAREANRRFGFIVDRHVVEALVVSYPEGGFFDWHTDLGDGDESTRKISFSIQLSEPEEYDGGQLQLVSCQQPLDNPRIGTLAAFPAHLAHRVTPVTRGERFALVAWLHGPSFR